MRHRWDFTENIEDKLALSAALAAACSLSISGVLDRLEPRISARLQTLAAQARTAVLSGDRTSG